MTASGFRGARPLRRADLAGRGCAAALAALLTACGTVAPVPQDVFLRLPPPREAPAAAAWTESAMRVAPLRANGLFKERALVYTDADGVALRQHRYLFWQDSPEVMLQLALAGFLRAAGVAPAVVTGSDADAALEVLGRVEAFERIEAPDGFSTRLVLELALQRRADSRTLLRERYEARTAAADRGPEATAVAMGAAVEAVFRRFLADAAALDPGPGSR